MPRRQQHRDPSAVELARRTLIARSLLRDCWAPCSSCGVKFKPAAHFPCLLGWQAASGLYRCARCRPWQPLTRRFEPRETLSSAKLLRLFYQAQGCARPHLETMLFHISCQRDEET